MFTTHMMGAYEDNENGLLHVDLLKFNNAETYTFHSFVDNALGKLLKLINIYLFFKI